MVEFQPSGWSRGSYLNVGAMWLWHPGETYIRYDVGGRVDEAGFVEYESDDQFAPLASRVAGIAADRVRELRDRFRDVGVVAEYLTAEGAGPGWRAYDAGVALALTGRQYDAQHTLRSLEVHPDSQEWWRSAVAHAHDLAALLDRGDRARAFRERLACSIADCRAALKLEPEWEMPR